MRLCSVAVIVLIFDIGICSLLYKSGTTPKESSTIEYYTKPKDHKIVPLMIHLDKTLINRLPKINRFKRRQKFKVVFENVLKEVEKLFGHPSLNLSINFKLLDVKILKNKINRIAIDENVTKYLRSYCKWQGENKMKKHKWWYSILFTGLDLLYKDRFGKEIRSSTGRGYMKGMCSIRNSCTLLEWHPDNIAYILAHEIGHSLGLSHDGPPHNECRGQRYIMDAVYNPHNPAKNWSPCNRREVKQYLTLVETTISVCSMTENILFQRDINDTNVP